MSNQEKRETLSDFVDNSMLPVEEEWRRELME